MPQPNPHLLPDSQDPWRGHSCLPRPDSSGRLRCIKAILFEPACLADAEGPFEDVAPALTELQALGIQLHTAADPAETLSLTAHAEGPFEDVAPALTDLQAMGIQLHAAADPAETLYVTDNAAGLAKANAA